MIAAGTTATTAAIVTLLSMKDAPPGLGVWWVRDSCLLVGGCGLGGGAVAEVHGQHADAVDRATALGERPGGRVGVLGGGVDADPVATGPGQRGPDAGEDVRGAVLGQDHEGVAGLGGDAAVTGDALGAGGGVALG